MALVKVVGRNKINRFAKRHADAGRPLAQWLKKTEAAKWNHAADIKNTFNSVDRVGTCYVFNIGGNRFRLVAVVVIVSGVVIIEKIMTHTEYDMWNKKQR